MVDERKILSLQELGDKARLCRQQGKQVSLCHGVFDLLHPGHVRHLKKARLFDDVLLVTINAASFVNKDPGRPVFPDTLRAESLAALSCVDFVAIHYGPTAVPVIHTIQPNVYVKGQGTERGECPDDCDIAIPSTHMIFPCLCPPRHAPGLQTP